MTNQPDVAAMFKDAMAAFPIDGSAAEGAFKSTAALNEKLSTVTLDAFGKSADVSSTWAHDTVKLMTEASKAKESPADYMQAMSDFAAGYSKLASAHMAAFTEIAKAAQADSMALMTDAGKGFTAEATAAVNTATKKAEAATK